MEYVLLYTTGTDPQPYDPAADNIGEWVDDVMASGISEWGERLRPGLDATTVQVRDGRTLATEGPFSEAREWVGGFDVIQCDHLDEAIKAAAGHPAARTGTVEVRPFVPGRSPGATVVPDGFHLVEPAGTRYLMMVCVDPDGPGEPADDVEGWVQDLDTRGVRLWGEALQPPDLTTLVRSRQGRTLVDAPPPADGIWIAGLDLIETESLTDAINAAAAHPMAKTGLIVLTPVWTFDPNEDHVARSEREEADWNARSEPSVAVPGA